MNENIPVLNNLRTIVVEKFCLHLQYFDWRFEVQNMRIRCAHENRKPNIRDPTVCSRWRFFRFSSWKRLSDLIPTYLRHLIFFVSIFCSIYVNFLFARFTKGLFEYFVKFTSAHTLLPKSGKNPSVPISAPLTLFKSKKGLFFMKFVMHGRW